MAAIVLIAQSGAASAVSFELGDVTTVDITNLFTVGAQLRLSERDLSNIGKGNVARLLGREPLCIGRVADDGSSGPDTNPDNNAFFGSGCPSSNLAANEAYVAAPGSFNPNGDNGNLNFDRYDITSATAKLTSDFRFDLYDASFFARSIYFFDAIYNESSETHPDTTLERGSTALPGAARSRHGSRFEFSDYYVAKSLELDEERNLTVRLGRQVLNWGESALLILNSLNSINPLDQARLVTPGFDVKELLQPQGMLYASTDLAPEMSLEGFYQYEWRPLVPVAPGHFLSTSDTLGDGGYYSMLSLGKQPEDPQSLYRPYRNPDDGSAVLGSQSSRTIYRDFEEEARRRPSDTGQYGLALKMFLEDFNHGTELAFYYANYHSRVPSVSAIAAQATCIPADSGDPAANTANLLTACEVPQQNIAALSTGGPYLPAGKEAVPADTIRILVEYPEDVHLYGVSFNTTIGDWALAGEYAFRDNLPIQIQAVDLVMAAAQPALPEDDFPIGGPGGAVVATVPGRRSATPDFLTGYRGGTPGQVLPGQYIRGYERMKIGQAGVTLLGTMGGDNLIGASQINLLLEVGHTHVLDFPHLSELQFQGAGTDTHISHGADGTVGINPPDVASQSASDPQRRAMRQNPTAHRDRAGFGTANSYGYRVLNLNKFESALFGANLETLLIWQHDLKGVSPGLGQNFVEGRKQAAFGLRFDYVARWLGELRYTAYTGGGRRDALRDRDHLLLSLGYLF